jgi:formylglycine-generating enzyme required for sulfatase activity
MLTPLLLLCSSRHTSPSSPDVEDLDLGSARLTIARIPPGKFPMGTDEVLRADDNWKLCATCSARNDMERPVHQVTISKEFWMGQAPVTQRQWRAVMGNNPSYSADVNPEAPVNLVSWEDTQEFIAKVNGRQRRWLVRLPTEAEWEYAARAGTKAETYAPLDDIAWYKGNYTGTTHPVEKKTAECLRTV